LKTKITGDKYILMERNFKVIIKKSSILVVCACFILSTQAIFSISAGMIKKIKSEMSAPENGWGKVSDMSKVQSPSSLDGLIGADAKAYNAAHFVRMIEIKYASKAAGYESVAQVFQMKNFNNALRVYLLSKPGGNNTKLMSAYGYANNKKRIVGLVNGPFFVKITTTTNAIKHIRRLAKAYKTKIDETITSISSKFYAKGSMPEEIMKLKQNGMLAGSKILTHTRYPKPFSIFDVPYKYIVKRDKKAKAHIFMVKKQTWWDAKNMAKMKKTPRMIKARKFAKKYKNRFRGIISNKNAKPTPKELKDSLESFRVNYFFGG